MTRQTLKKLQDYNSHQSHGIPNLPLALGLAELNSECIESFEIDDHTSNTADYMSSSTKNDDNDSVTSQIY